MVHVASKFLVSCKIIGHIRTTKYSDKHRQYYDIMTTVYTIAVTTNTVMFCDVHVGRSFSVCFKTASDSARSETPLPSSPHSFPATPISWPAPDLRYSFPRSHWPLMLLRPWPCYWWHVYSWKVAPFPPRRSGLRHSTRWSRGRSSASRSSARLLESSHKTGLKT